MALSARFFWGPFTISQSQGLHRLHEFSLLHWPKTQSKWMDAPESAPYWTLKWRTSAYEIRFSHNCWTPCKRRLLTKIQNAIIRDPRNVCKSLKFRRRFDISFSPKKVNLLDWFRSSTSATERSATLRASKIPTRRSVGRRSIGLVEYRNVWNDFFTRKYTWTHRNDGQSCDIRHENFEKFEMFSTPTGSWIRSRRRRRRDRIQLPVGVENISNFSKFSCRMSRDCPSFRWYNWYQESWPVWGFRWTVRPRWQCLECDPYQHRCTFSANYFWSDWPQLTLITLEMPNGTLSITGLCV